MNQVVFRLVDIHESLTFAFPTRLSVSVGSHSNDSQQVHIRIWYLVVKPCLCKNEQAALLVNLLVDHCGQLINLIWQRVHIPRDDGGK